MHPFQVRKHFLCAGCDVTQWRTLIGWHTCTAQLSKWGSTAESFQVEFEGQSKISKMPTCCVPLCTNSGRIDGMKLYQFPKDEDRRQIWTLNVRRHGWKPTNTSKICQVNNKKGSTFCVQLIFDLQAHFDRSEFKLKGSKLRLLKDAVPTLFRHSVPKPKRRKPPHPRGRKDEMSNADKEYIRQHDHNYAAQASSQPQTSEPTTKPSPVQEQDPSQDLMNVPDPMAVLGPTEMAMPSESSSEIVETCIENGPGLGIHEVETGALRLRIKLLEEELAREKMAHSRLKRRMLRIVKKKTSSNERKKSNKKVSSNCHLGLKSLDCWWLWFAAQDERGVNHQVLGAGSMAVPSEWHQQRLWLVVWNHKKGLETKVLTAISEKRASLFIFCWFQTRLWHGWISNPVGSRVSFTMSKDFAAQFKESQGLGGR